MLKKVSPLLALAVVALALVAGAYAQNRTTGPEHVDNVNVKLRDNGYTLSKATFLRGGSARFVATNLGTKPYTFKIGVVATPLLKPGKTGIILAELDFRGTFPTYQLSAAGKRLASVKIKIK